MAAQEQHTRIVRPLRGGQITIPVEFRRALGISDDSLLQLTIEDDELRIRKLRVAETVGTTEWFKDLYDHFAPLREEIIERGIGEDEVNADIDAALAEVRRRNA
jgi:bifunctional DNA-binding transcriptional regulator/antitoxin component of YhaV-PrlF toxin-antitoxin module